MLRGEFRRSGGRLTWLKQYLRRGVKRPSFKEAQREAAGAVGFTGKYFLAEHLPYPMRCSTLHNYYAMRADELRQQAGHRFRSGLKASSRASSMDTNGWEYTCIVLSGARERISASIECRMAKSPKLPLRLAYTIAKISLIKLPCSSRLGTCPR